MLKMFRGKQTFQKVVFVFILVLMTVGMVLYLIPGFTGFTGDPTVSGVVAKVAGEEIQAYELQQAIFQFGQTNRIPSEMMGTYSTQILNSLVMARATRQEAARLGLHVSEEEMVERLHQIPDLFPGGRFVGRQAYEDLVYSRYNVTVSEFERRFRDSLLQEKLRELVTDSVVVEPAEVRKAFEDANEKLVLDYALIDTNAMKAEIKPKDEELQAYYKANQARYQVPERRTIRAIVFNQNTVAQGITIPEADMRKYYQDHPDAFRTEERVQVSHILLKTPDPAKKDEVKKKAEDLLAKLKAGADFAKLARENSEDPGSASKGGDLGWIVRGQTVAPFEAAAFNTEPGKLSDVVESSFGFHILKVTAHEKARVVPFEEAKPEILTTMRQERVAAMLPRQADEAEAALRRTPDDAEAIAKRLNAQVANIGPIQQSDSVPEFGGSPEANQEVFILQKGEVGRPIPTQTGYVVPMVTDVLPPHQGEYEEVKDRVRSDYVDQQAQERASAKATELSEAVGKQEKKDLKRAAQALHLMVTSSGPVTRTSRIPGVGSLQDLDPTLFTKAVGDVAGPFPTAGGHVILQITSREEPKEEDFKAQQSTLEQQLLQQKKQQAYAVFEDNLRARLEEKGELVINQDVLSRLAPSSVPVLPPNEHPNYPHTHPAGF